MAAFELVSDYRPTGDQPEAIAALVEGFRAGRRYRARSRDCHWARTRSYTSSGIGVSPNEQRGSS